MLYEMRMAFIVLMPRVVWLFLIIRLSFYFSETVFSYTHIHTFIFIFLWKLISTHNKILFSCRTTNHYKISDKYRHSPLFFTIAFQLGIANSTRVLEYCWHITRQIIKAIYYVVDWAFLRVSTFQLFSYW